MREILFRGKRTDNGEWVEGYYIRVVDLHYISSGIFDSLTNGIINTRGYKVDPETVGQYTGLCDNNGRKIFEGDILGGFLDEEYPEHETVVVVEWHENMWVTRQGEYLPDLLELDDSDCFEVIGNIYDNPELLEVKQNG